VVINNLIRAHRHSYDILHTNSPNCNVGIAKNNAFFEAMNKRFFNRLLAAPLNYWGNHYFLKMVKSKLDFIGINFYFHSIVNLANEPRMQCVRSDMGWEMCSWGIYYVIEELRRYNLPIYITENGVADFDDEIRSGFIKDILHYVHLAIEKGADVKGYFYWSFLDNFEWDKGFWPRFGLVGFDRETQERTIKRSAWDYAEIISRDGFITERDPSAELAKLS